MVSKHFSLRYSSYYLFRISVESVSSGGGAIFIEAYSSVYIRDNVGYGVTNYEPVTTDLYVNPRNFDIVRIEGLRAGRRNCPREMTGTLLR